MPLGWWTHPFLEGPFMTMEMRVNVAGLSVIHTMLRRSEKSEERKASDYGK